MYDVSRATGRARLAAWCVRTAVIVSLGATAAAAAASIVAAAVVAAAPADPPAATTTLIPPDSFTSQDAFDAVWAYNYPWGTDHNGAARMDPAQAVLSPANNTLTLIARRLPASSHPKPAHHGGQDIPIHYLAGAVHARAHLAVARRTTLELAGRFRAPVARGTWPAFWLTAVDGWPPEVDLAEWKGSGKISFNTFNTSSQVAARDVAYPRPDAFHDVRCVLRDENGADVAVAFYLDGAHVTTQVGRGFTGKALYLIINLQMEGSSGSPGPETDTQYAASNVSVVSYKS
ncbi:Concanavalin A-like lectin/glucanase [Niveomyces insectorum RCEF 264]|uniref:Concanavalin A-like lectin/glucanase n=1 Tax=Niveomyces insectorum RCEF 264 TaxID=1081102 RepID=A0A167RIF8_9HYPO|nr:Concanavalin A-like lectin/glucanase [Niveomyces insectorum RCEF 264]